MVAAGRARVPFESLPEFFRLAARGLLDPFVAFVDPSKRTYGPFLALAALVATGVWLARGRRRGSLATFLFPKRIWLDRSALLDYRLMFARAVLRFTLLSPLAFSELAVAATLASWLSEHVGSTSGASALDRTVVTILYSATAFIAEDLARYAVHRLAHRVPALWELHKVHHSATVMTPLTVQRAHPLESVLMRAGAQLAVGIVTGLFLWLFPGRLAAWEILGVYGLSFLWAALGANLRHSHVWLSYGPIVEHVFISPAQHQIHHGDRLEQYDTNFGSALAIWDWAFGSLRVTSARRPALRFGLPPDQRNHGDTVGSAFVDPLVAALRTLLPRRPRRASSSSAPASRALVRRAVLAAVAVLAFGAVEGCVRVQRSYRDVGTDTRDAPSVDAPRSDAPRDAAPFDSPRPDVPLLDVLLGDTPLGVGPDATRAALSAVGEFVIVASVRDFEAAAVALAAATEAASASGTPEARDAARAAWRAAMRVWQRVEAVQVGPAGLALHTTGGRGLRDEIYAWPLVSWCSIDGRTVDGTHADPALLRAAAVSVRGLAAIEYLLFYERAHNGCPVTAAINVSGAWAALGDPEVARRRLVYAHTAAVLVVARARELRLAWEPAGENFLGALSSAGAGSSVYPSALAGLNALSDALFYLYREVVDLKLGVPAGIHVDCPTETCPDNVESRWAGASLDHIRVNLEAFRDAYLGAPPGLDAAGFDDLLRSIGAGDLDARVQGAIATALASVDPVLEPLELAIAADHADVVVLHEDIRTLAELFKLEVLAVLDLSLPNRIEGDND